MAQEKDVQNKAEDSAQRRKRPFAKTSPSQEGKAATIGWRILGIACVCMSLLFLAVRSGMFDHTFSPRHGRHVFQPIPDPPNERYSASELLAIGKELSTRGNAKSYQLAADYLRKAAELGKVEAQFLLAEIYDRGRGVPQSREKALFWYRKAAEGRLYPQESREAMFILGRAYETGDGVPQDKAQAAEWYRQAAGKPAAAFALWRLYDAGDGVPQDKKKALDWLRTAVDLRDCDAEYHLGGMYETGDGMPQDKKKALALYKESANSYCESAGAAQFALWRMYDTGDGVPQDKKKALDWLRKAAGSGHAAAAYTLGMMYYRGDVLEKDIHEAAILLQRAAKNGDEKALDAMRQDDLRKALEEAGKAQ